MKRILVTLSLLVILSLGAKAQDSFFSYNNIDEERSETTTPNIPFRNFADNQNAPLGGGLLLLLSMGVGYAMYKKKEL